MKILRVLFAVLPLFGCSPSYDTKSLGRSYNQTEYGNGIEALLSDITLTSQMTAYAFARHRAGKSDDSRKFTEAMVEFMMYFLLKTPEGELILLDARLLGADAVGISLQRQERTQLRDGRMDLSVRYSTSDAPSEQHEVILELKVTAPLTIRQVNAYRRHLGPSGRLIVVCPEHEKFAVQKRLLDSTSSVVESKLERTSDSDLVITYSELAQMALDQGISAPQIEAWKFISDFVNASHAPSLRLDGARSLQEEFVASYFADAFGALGSQFDSEVGDQTDYAEARAVALGDDDFGLSSAGAPKKPLKRPAWSVHQSNAGAWFQSGGAFSRTAPGAWRMYFEADPEEITVGGNLFWYGIAKSNHRRETLWVRSPSLGKGLEDEEAARMAKGAGRIIWSVMYGVARLGSHSQLNVEPKAIALDREGASGIKLTNREYPNQSLDVVFDPRKWCTAPELGPIFLQLSPQLEHYVITRKSSSLDRWRGRNVAIATYQDGEEYLSFILESIIGLWGEDK